MLTSSQQRTRCSHYLINFATSGCTPHVSLHFDVFSFPYLNYRGLKLSVVSCKKAAPKNQQPTTNNQQPTTTS
ncbi:MAG TPA: hypothetical protein DCE56_14090 [Cyanobacteria bacterium UBA8553]|nr:hypothetical protein [Cyanobacteria bacterium UBA8553]